MPVISNDTNREELTARRSRILTDLDTTWNEISDRRHAGRLTPDEWEAWEELDGINYLLGE